MKTLNRLVIINIQDMIFCAYRKKAPSHIFQFT